MKLSQTVLLTVFLVSALTSVSASDDFELIMVVEFFRHGARGPLGTIIKDNWAYGGELTEVGLRQHYIEGRELRRRYPSLLPEHYNYTFVHTQSTNYNRTIMSAIAHNLGLFPLETGPKMPKDYPHERAVPPFPLTVVDPKKVGDFAIPNGFQPVPINTIETKDDYMLYPTDSCPALAPHHKTFQTTELWKKASEIFSAQYPKWEKAFDLKNLTLNEWHSVYDSFYADYFQNNKTAIPFDNEIVPNLSMTYQVTLNYYDYPDDMALKLTVQPTLEKLFEIIDKRVEPNGSLMKWFTFSGHDDNILNFMLAFNLTSLDCQLKKMSTGYPDMCLPTPPYASLILFEIYNDTKTGGTYIKFIFNDEEYDICPYTAKSASNRLCEYNAVKSDLKQKYFVPNWKEACGLIPPDPTADSNLFIVLFLVFTAMIIALAAGLGIVRKKMSLSFVGSQGDSFGSGNSYSGIET